MSGGRVRSISIEWVCMEYRLCFSMSIFISTKYCLSVCQQKKKGSLINCISCALTFCVNLVLNKRLLILQEKGQCHWVGEETDTCCEGRKPECLPNSWNADMMHSCKYLFGPAWLHSSFGCGVIYVVVHSHSSLWLCEPHLNHHFVSSSNSDWLWHSIKTQAERYHSHISNESKPQTQEFVSMRWRARKVSSSHVN